MKRMLAIILALIMILSSLNAAIAHRKSPAKHPSSLTAATGL